MIRLVPRHTLTGTAAILVILETRYPTSDLSNSEFENSQKRTAVLDSASMLHNLRQIHNDT